VFFVGTQGPLCFYENWALCGGNPWEAFPVKKVFLGEPVQEVFGCWVLYQPALEALKKRF